MVSNTESTITTILPIILGSSLLTALLSSVSSFFKSSRESKIENITQERASWRERIRNISNNLESSIDLTMVLNEIKLNINPYGQLYRDISTEEGLRAWINEDGYVWKAIRSVEDNSSVDNISGIIGALGVLLKLDWERSKKEIKGEKLINFIATSLFLYYTMIISIVAIYVLDGGVLNYQNEDRLFLATAMVSFLLVAPWVWIGAIKALNGLVTNLTNVRLGQKNRRLNWLQYLGLIVVHIIGVAFLGTILGFSIFSPVILSNYFISNFGHLTVLFLGALMTVCGFTTSYCYQKYLEPKILELYRIVQILDIPEYRVIMQQSESLGDSRMERRNAKRNKSKNKDANENDQEKQDLND